MARPKDIGTQAETAVVKYLRLKGFPHAERRALRGAYDCGDVTGVPSTCIEVKGGNAARQASDEQVLKWLAETETERINAEANWGVLVMQRKGIGAPRAGQWWAVMDLEHLHALLNGERVRPIGTRAFVPVRLTLSTVASLIYSVWHGTETSLEDQ